MILFFTNHIYCVGNVFLLYFNNKMLKLTRTFFTQLIKLQIIPEVTKFCNSSITYKCHPATGRGGPRGSG